MTTPPPKPRFCPICRKKLIERTQRFCSDRCAQVDLGRWLSGDYAIPAVEQDDTPEEP